MTAGLPVLPAAGHVWSEQERSVLRRAEQHAQRCGLVEPWSVRVHDDRIEIVENVPAPLRGHVGADRNGAIACGCALAVVTCAVRILGWAPETVLFGDPDRAELVATVVAHQRYRPSPADVGRFRAVFEQHGRSDAFEPAGPAQLPLAVRDTIVRAGTVAGVRMVPVAAVVAAHRKRGLEAGLLVVTTTDGRRGQLLAGTALQRARLSATALGLPSKPVIEPFETREFRHRLVRHSGVEGCPQSLLVLGRSPASSDA
ncbi:hypothetical protein [Saccharomonospora sp.]|uniref:hypothetical protein n=1 Tax=Saccharomonospora sp. TaxID=33913 RepID=UPI00261605FB|nr:hypothetical protein [Saccharomonospora sp.]